MAAERNMAESALAQSPMRDVAALLRKTQRQLVRNWLLDCVSLALWWPAALLAVAGGFGLVGHTAPLPWIAATTLAAWAIATTVVALRSRTKIGDAAHWLDRSSDSQGLFVTTAHMLKKAELLSPAGHYLYASAQRRAPTARVRSAALIGWRVPRHAGFSVLLVLCSIAMLTRPSNVNSVDTTEPRPALLHSENTVHAPIEDTQVARSTLAKKLANALNQNDGNLTDSDTEDESSANALNVATTQHSPASSEETPSDMPTQANATAGSGGDVNLVQAANEPTNQSGGATVQGSGRLAGSEIGSESSPPNRPAIQSPLARTEYLELALESGSTVVAQDRAGASLSPSTTANRVSAKPTSVASPAHPSDIPLPAAFSHLERSLVANYFRELNLAQ